MPFSFLQKWFSKGFKGGLYPALSISRFYKFCCFRHPDNMLKILSVSQRHLFSKHRTTKLIYKFSRGNNVISLKSATSRCCGHLLYTLKYKTETQIIWAGLIQPFSQAYFYHLTCHQRNMLLRGIKMVYSCRASVLKKFKWIGARRFTLFKMSYQLQHLQKHVPVIVDAQFCWKLFGWKKNTVIISGVIFSNLSNDQQYQIYQTISNEQQTFSQWNLFILVRQYCTYHIYNMLTSFSPYQI